MAERNDLLGGYHLYLLHSAVRMRESVKTLIYMINVIKCMCMQSDCISAKKSL